MKDKKITKKLLAILLLLFCVAIIIVAFVGVFIPTLNKITNIIPDYKYGTEIDGIMEYRLSPDDTEEEKDVYVDAEGKFKGEVVEEDNGTTIELETTDESAEEEHNHDIEGLEVETRTVKANEDSVLTKENFEKSKELISERLKNVGATEYSLRLNEQTGDLVVELSPNDNVDFLNEVALSSQGKFQIIDSQTGVILLDRSHLDGAGVASDFDQETGSYTVYLQIQLTEEGSNIFRDISKKYTEYVDADGETKKDYIEIQVDGSTIMSTYFQEEYIGSIINIPIGQNIKTESELKTFGDSVSAIANMLNMDEVPVKYKVDTQLFIKSTLDKEIFGKVFKITMIVYLVVVTVIFILKDKLKGLVAGIINAGFIGLLVVVLKFLEIVITFSSLMAFLGLLILNAVFLKIYLKNLREKVEKPFLNSIKYYYSVIAPVVIVGFVFTFFTNVAITGIGFVLFWGLLIEILFNIIVTRSVLSLWA